MRRLTVYVDESGDVGFSVRSSKHLTLVALATEAPLVLERIPKKVRRTLLMRRHCQVPELKFHASSPRVRRAFLEMVRHSEGVRAVSIVVKKTVRSSGRRGEQADFYDQVCAELAVEIAHLGRYAGYLSVVFDSRPMTKVTGHSPDSRMVAQIRREYDAMRCIPPEIRVSRLDSQNSGGLQIADFIAGAIQRSHEHGDESYRNIIAPLMVQERILVF